MAMPKYYIPSDLEQAIKENEGSASIRGADILSNKFSTTLKELKSINCLEIEECHFLQFMKLGLYLEEYQQRKDRNKIQIRGSKIEKVQGTKKFKIYMKCLDTDKDESVLHLSDSFIVFEYTDPDTVFYLNVLEICNDHVIVTGDHKFCNKHSDSGRYSVVQIFNAYTFQCCHYALSEITSYMISNYFFPKTTPTNLQTLNNIETWFNTDVSNNPEQKQAVVNIINNSSFPAPYILYGPPGTGKTSTLVEAICQTWKLPSRHYILICAPSNAACDVITKRLLNYIPTKNLFRIYSQSQEYCKIDEDIKKCCNYNDDGKVQNLQQRSFKCKDIIITTLCTSLRLKKFMLPFSHVFIDEASQAKIPDAFLPLCAGTLETLQIVISGDHQQLGPSIRSKLAEPLIGQSILETLMKQDPYKKDEIVGYDPRYVTKLIRNFRSCKEIIHVPNILFYDNELIACINTTAFPVAFYAVEGKEQKTSDSKSSYNEEEINQVLFHVRSFIGKIIGNKVISETDIGIVTPFSLQATQIRTKLNSIGLKDVDVGTVEIYQGQEKEVIIVSTVRSKSFIHDGVEHIGFLSNPKRFNVALTRAKSFLAVVGSPSVVQINKYWRCFLRFCQENNACHGNAFVIKSELYYQTEELYIGNESKKSTDLFERSFNNILTIDDGYMTSNRWINNNSLGKNPLVRLSTTARERSAYNSNSDISDSDITNSEIRVFEFSDSDVSADSEMTVYEFFYSDVNHSKTREFEFSDSQPRVCEFSSDSVFAV